MTLSIQSFQTALSANTGMTRAAGHYLVQFGEIDPDSTPLDLIEKLLIYGFRQIYKLIISPLHQCQFAQLSGLLLKELDKQADSPEVVVPLPGGSVLKMRQSDQTTVSLDLDDKSATLTNTSIKTIRENLAREIIQQYEEDDFGIATEDVNLAKKILVINDPAFIQKLFEPDVIEKHTLRHPDIGINKRNRHYFNVRYQNMRFIWKKTEFAEWHGQSMPGASVPPPAFGQGITDETEMSAEANTEQPSPAKAAWEVHYSNEVAVTGFQPDNGIWRDRNGKPVVEKYPLIDRDRSPLPIPELAKSRRLSSLDRVILLLYQNGLLWEKESTDVSWDELEKDALILKKQGYLDEWNPENMSFEDWIQLPSRGKSLSATRSTPRTII